LAPRQAWQRRRTGGRADLGRPPGSSPSGLLTPWPWSSLRRHPGARGGERCNPALRPHAGRHERAGRDPPEHVVVPRDQLAQLGADVGLRELWRHWARANRITPLGSTEEYWPCKSNSVCLGSSPRAPARVGGLRAFGRGPGRRASPASLLLFPPCRVAGPGRGAAPGRLACRSALPQAATPTAVTLVCQTPLGSPSGTTCVRCRVRLTESSWRPRSIGISACCRLTI
jgi:hypothetical protein